MSTRPTPIASPKPAKARQRADELLVAAVAGGQSLREAAARSGVSARTAERRSTDPAFQRAVAEARAAMLEEATARLTRAATAAAAVLTHLMAPEQPGSVRLRAAVSVLEQGLKLRTAGELEQRVAELEARLAPTKHNGWR